MSKDDVVEIKFEEHEFQQGGFASFDDSVEIKTRTFKAKPEIGARIMEKIHEKALRHTEHMIDASDVLLDKVSYMHLVGYFRTNEMRTYKPKEDWNQYAFPNQINTQMGALNIKVLDIRQEMCEILLSPEDAIIRAHRLNNSGGGMT